MITALDEHTALVLIDLQKGIVDANLSPTKHDVVANAARLKTAFGQEKLSIVVVHVNPIGAPASLVRSEKGNFPKDKEGQRKAIDTMKANNFFDILDPVIPEPGDLQITKEGWNAFYNTTLHNDLQQLGITGIVLAGISTSIGVEGTARSANERGYNITFATDAMTDTVAAAHQNSLTYIFPRIGELATTDEVIAMLPTRGKG